MNSSQESQEVVWLWVILQQCKCSTSLSIALICKGLGCTLHKKVVILIYLFQVWQLLTHLISTQLLSFSSLKKQKTVFIYIVLIGRLIRLIRTVLWRYQMPGYI